MTDFLYQIAEALDQIVWEVNESYYNIIYCLDNLEFMLNYGKIFIIIASILLVIILIMLLFVLINQGELKRAIKTQQATIESLLDLHEQDSKRDRAIYEQDNKNSGERKPDGTL